MPKVTIKAGDCLTSIAHASGHDPNTIWDHPDNEGLKELRERPSALLPGDVLEVPAIEEKEESVSTGSVGRFKLSIGPVHVRVTLTRQGEPRADEAFELLIEGHDPIAGTTDGDGKIDEVVPPDTKVAILSLNDGKEQIKLKLGHLDPHDTPSGVQHRLRALGYYFGALDADHGDRTAAALRRFQTKQGLEVTGEADDATMSALRDAYGS